MCPGKKILIQIQHGGRGNGPTAPKSLNQGSVFQRGKEKATGNGTEPPHSDGLREPFGLRESDLVVLLDLQVHLRIHELGLGSFIANPGGGQVLHCLVDFDAEHVDVCLSHLLQLI